MEGPPLRGVRVLELAGLAPAPFCGMILADFGADVIRVDRQGDASGGRDFLARGKRSIALNLKKKEGIQVLLKLIEKADVLIDPFRPGVAERLGFGPDAAMKVNPRLIYARLTGWGQTGPYANMAGHDMNYIAISGALSTFGKKDQSPTFPVNLLGDFAGGGMVCALGIVISLFERNKSNKGQVIDCAMIDGASYLNTFVYQMFKLGAWKLERGTNTLDGGAPFYDVYITKDRKYLSVGCLEPQFFTSFIKGLGLDPSSFDQMDESSWPQMRKIFSETIASKTRSEWEKIFDGTDSCVAPILSLDEFDSHSQNVARKTVIKDEQGNSHISAAPKLSRTPAIVPRGSVMLDAGAHTKAILKDFGFSLPEISELEKNSIISSSNPTAAL